MTIVSLSALHMKPGASWADIKEQIKRGPDLNGKKGGENAPVRAGIAAETATGTLTFLSTNADWASYGKFQDALWADPELQALIDNPNSPVAKWDTYVL